MRKQPKYAAAAKIGENDVNELIKASSNWEHSADGQAFEREMKKMEDEIMNDPEVKKAMGEAMQEFANLENEVMQAMQSPEGQAAAAQAEADMKFVAQVL